jgi:hypothetical protein
METTALYSPACSIAKARLGWTVAGWALEVPSMEISVRFHSATD